MNMLHSQTQRLLRKVNCTAVSLLIVEDNDASRRLVVELLRAAGFTSLSFARNAEEALEHLQNQAPDLMLLDWNLPGMSGLELVTLIRGAALKPDGRIPDPALPIVMLTARQRADDVTRARDAGINEFVVKPFSTTSLLRAISSALTQKRQPVAEAVVSERRRRKAQLFPGLLRRPESNGKPNPIDTGLNTLRGLISHAGQKTAHKTAKKTDVEAVNQTVLDLMQSHAEAHTFRLRLVELAAQSLNDYMRLFGDHADPEVVDVHLDALIRLNEVPYAHPDDAQDIVRHLKVLVTKRKTTRKAVPKKVAQ
ncbi:response regulator [Asticcacaulis sp.]|uniref:response regulator n=1 Tax=Asticcacaulis sp. TaxID=1872648 RepID=UPI002C05C77D|nr:response regulator [Asticcacaulis sp.]HTM81169.1 response regulator [Asticcacaulis sp.]